ncbi:hypothetical protein VNN36_04600 [Lactococcus garvieae]|uniref:hypothetical protein n=1 Tax=Lactococcus garvieae TaxID=1363 RepID=UPI0030D49443
MELKCTDCMVTFQAPYGKDCPFCGTDAFVVELSNNTEKLEKKLAAAVEALDEINNLAIDVAMNYEETEVDSVNCVDLMDIVIKAKQALAEIGG